MDVYENEKIRFSALQSSFHKLLNSVKRGNINIDHLHDINETMEILEAKIINYNDDAIIDSRKQDIAKNNKVITDLTPIFIMYRILLDN
jgi:hypothetical protein